MATGDPSSILAALVLAGLLGALGQSARTVAGLKKMNDEAAKQGLSSADVFIAARLFVSLMIGFLAGVAAGLALGLDKLLVLDSGGLQVMLGIAAAGYAGTDFIEAFAPSVSAAQIPPLPRLTTGAVQPQGVAPIVMNTATLPQTSTSATSTNAADTKYGASFGSLVPNGFFSSDPDDLKVPRAVRTNNPGALNFTSWQKTRPGYVGVSQPDDSPNHNITTIYRTPEHGVAAWYHLVAGVYNFPGGAFTLNDLATRYAGSNDPGPVGAYLAGWNKWLMPPVTPTTRISVDDGLMMTILAKAMFSHEAGIATPLHDDQVSFAIQRERSGTLPA